MNRSRTHPSKSNVRVLSPLREFLRKEAAGAVLLALAALIALVWVNSPWSDAYESFWSSRVVFIVAGHSFDLDLQHWVNDGLMTIFFFVVGLEIKRELTSGHLAERRAAMLPALAAVGGMIIPAVVYLFIAGASAPRGWAVPVATDIALAVGVLAVAGSRVPSALRAFLLGLAIVDDIGAIIIIAAFYSSGVSTEWLGMSVCGVVVAVAARRLGVRLIPFYVVVGAVVWLGLYEGGVHPTLAGVVMGLLAPSTPFSRADVIDADDDASVSEINAAIVARAHAKETVSVVEWLEHHLHPWTSLLIVPVFAFANSGIHVSMDAIANAIDSPVTWGIFFGLVVGKPLGILLATKAAVSAGVADAPPGASTRQVFGVGSAAGIGFTVAIFITKLAFADPAQQVNAKLAILVASLLSAGISAGVLLRRNEARITRRSRT